MDSGGGVGVNISVSSLSWEEYKNTLEISLEPETSDYIFSSLGI